jgi:carbon monoxide dehydrogenase subunit G
VDLEHSFTVPASIEETWKAFQDIESVAGCFPGATVTSFEGDDFKGSCKVKLGPIALVYSGQGTFVEKDEAAHRFVIEAKGKDKRGNGTAGATVTATLADEGGSSTKVDVVTDLAITGKPAQFGRGVIQDVSDKLLQQFVTCLQSKVGSSPEASAEAEQAPDAQPEAGPSSEATATAVTETESPPAPAPKPVAGASPGARKAPSSTYGGVSTGTPGAASSSGGGTSKDDALDLGATVLPILARTYWKQALGGLAGAAVLWWLVKRLF